MENISKEFELLKERYGIRRVVCSPDEDVADDKMYVLENEAALSEKFLEKKPNCITMKEVAGLQTASELVAPEIPMLINTIENTYENIAVYGKGKYADKIYKYLLGNKNINVFRIEEADLNFLKNSYCIQCKQKIDMLLILDFLVDRTVYNQIGEIVLTIFARKMYYSNLKSTGNNLDINKKIIPLLLRNHIQVIWVGIPDFEKIRNHNKIGHAIRLWSLLRSVNEELFYKIRNYKFGTLYLLKESRSVHNSNVKGISEVYFNGQYINFESGFRVTPGNSQDIKKNIWLFGPCFVRGLNFDDDHTMSAKLKKIVTDQYNVINRGTVNTCLNYVMRMAEYHIGDIVVFFSPEKVPEQKNPEITYLDMTDILNSIPKLEKHITDSFFHCDEIVIDAIVKNIAAQIKTDNAETDNYTIVRFGSEHKRAPALDMLPANEYTDWLCGLKNLRKEGYNGAIVMNANPFTNGHRYLIEYAARRVDYLYIIVVEEDKSYFAFKDRFNLVKEGTKDLENVIVFPSSRYIISSSSLPGYFNKEKMKGDFKLDATQDLVAFTQAAEILNIKIRFAGEEPLDPFTNQYNINMNKILPQYGMKFEVIPRKKEGTEVVSASLVRKYLQSGELEKIKELVPESAFRFIYGKWN